MNSTLETTVEETVAVEDYQKAETYAFPCPNVSWFFDYNVNLGVLSTMCIIAIEN
jgi:hypothetical protein